MGDDRRWNHNIQYHPLVLDALPSPCERVLDAGCGEGVLTQELAHHAKRVVGIDLDGPSIETARRKAAAPNITYVVGDVVTADLAPGSFDAVVSVAVLHHLDTVVALERLRELVRPGGVVAVIGLARSHLPQDGAWELAGAVSTRIHRLTKGWWETSAPKVWPPPQTFAETRADAERILPGCCFRRHVLWRYSLVWTKPLDDG